MSFLARMSFGGSRGSVSDFAAPILLLALHPFFPHRTRFLDTWLASIPHKTVYRTSSHAALTSHFNRLNRILSGLHGVPFVRRQQQLARAALDEPAHRIVRHLLPALARTPARLADDVSRREPVQACV